MYKAVLSGFESMEDVKSFLSWYEGHGEQFVAEWTGKHFNTTGQMIVDENSACYMIKTYKD